jgi:hypothetical protein
MLSSNQSKGAYTSSRKALRTLAVVGGAAAAISLSACLSLQIDNPNDLAISSVFTSAANAEAAIVGSFRAYFSLNEGTCPTLPLSVYGNEITTTSVTYLDYSTEPKIPINNTDNLNCLTRYAWNTSLEASAGARESYQGIIANGLKYGTVDASTPNGKDTPSRLIFAKFIIALSQLKLGLDFDKAYITDVNSPPGSTGGDFHPYKEVVSNAIVQLRGVIADSRATADFTFPIAWINTRAITRDELIRICQSYIVRAQIYSARSPEERAAVNWSGVLALLDSGIVRDFAQQADPAITATASVYIDNSYAQNTVRINNRLIGPADTSGVYQSWLAKGIATRAAITITTPDRRIHGAAGNTAVGTRFTRLATTMSSSANGSYLLSAYRSNRYLNSAADSGKKALVNFMTLDEMKFIKAEALYRLNRGAEAAALINPTRLAAGLKPADANGPPAGRDCVPRKDDGTCGSLFDAIQYEKRIELYPLEGDLAWFDQRGWGKLLPGTPVSLPVSGRELLTLGFPYYTFGGSAGGGAP